MVRARPWPTSAIIDPGASNLFNMNEIGLVPRQEAAAIVRPGDETTYRQSAAFRQFLADWFSRHPRSRADPPFAGSGSSKIQNRTSWFSSLLFLPRFRAFAGDGQAARFDADFDLLLAENRHLSLDLEAIFRLHDVHMNRMKHIQRAVLAF